MPAVPFPREDDYQLTREYADALKRFLENQARLYKETENEELEFLPGDKKPMLDDVALEEYEKVFARKYKYPKELDGVDFLDSSDDDEGSDDYINDEDEDQGEEETIGKNYESANPIPKPILDSLAQQSGMYTEGGTIVPLRRDVIRPGQF